MTSHAHDDVRARIQEKQDRAKLVLEASKMALDAQSKQMCSSRNNASRLEISNLFGQQSYTLPADPTPERKGRRSVSPMNSPNSGNYLNHESTRNSIAADWSMSEQGQHTGRPSVRNRVAQEMGNRSGARAVAANLNASNIRDMSVNHLLAGSRSERVRRMSQAAAGGGLEKRQPPKKDAALELFEQDERNFIAEIPIGFQPTSPPTCEKPRQREQRYTDNARIPIELDDFGGEGYLLRNDFSFGAICNKQSNRTDSICLPMERMKENRRSGEHRRPKDSFFADHSEIILVDTEDEMKENRPSADTTIFETNACRLLGGNMDGNDCLDCSDQCKCVAVVKPKKDENNDCDKKKAMDYCDQHLSYLERVMRHLDLKSDSTVCASPVVTKAKQKTPVATAACHKRQRNVVSDCCEDKEMKACSAARRARSMVTSDCCNANVGEDSEGRTFADHFFQQQAKQDGGSGSCGNDENLGKAMSVCSQQQFGRMEEMDGGNCQDGGMRRAASSMSEFNFVNGYLPLKSTHNELSWGSVKLRKMNIKTFQIKNTSPKRLIIRVILDGPGFNFETNEAEARGTLTLQPNEVRTLALVFNPTVLGPAVGNLIFQPPIEYCAAGGGCATMSNINSRVTKRVVRLYGYGGHVAMSFERLQQGPVGAKFLPLGNLCNLSKVFEETFIIRNKGNLTGFAAVMLENKTVGKSMFDRAISICPDKVLIPPNTSVRIKVSFQPSNNDMKEMMKIHRMQEVIAVGNILVVTGDEPTRCRIKRLIQNSQDLTEKYSSAQLKNIWADYGSRDCDYDLSELRETGLAVADLIGSFQSKEVALTVNNSVTDMSLIDASGWIEDMEESDELFHTICQPNDNSECCRSPIGGDVNMMPLQATKIEQEEDPCNPDEWHVEPGALSFNTNSPLPEILTIHAKVSKDRMFEVDSNVANYFCVSPQEGVLTPSCAKTNISVRMMNYNVPPCQLFIYIYIENDRICVPVTVERGPPEGRPTCNKISAEKVLNMA